MKSSYDPRFYRRGPDLLGDLPSPHSPEVEEEPLKAKSVGLSRHVLVRKEMNLCCKEAAWDGRQESGALCLREARL